MIYNWQNGYHRGRQCKFPNGATALPCACRRRWSINLACKEGDELNVVAASKETIEVETRKERRRRAIERMAARNWTLPPDYKFDRDEANER